MNLASDLLDQAQRRVKSVVTDIVFLIFVPLLLLMAVGVLVVEWALGAEGSFWNFSSGRGATADPLADYRL